MNHIYSKGYWPLQLFTIKIGKLLKKQKINRNNSSVIEKCHNKQSKA